MIQIKKVISFMMMLCVLVSIFVSLSCEILQPEEDEIIISTDGYETDFTLTSGQTGKGYLNIDETHNWTFSANEGDQISASTGVRLEDSNMSMNIKLIAPNGDTLDTDSMSGNGAYVSDTATETGVYTLVVYEWHQDNEGEYTINLVVSGGELTISTDDEGGAIASGSKEHGTLTFGDIDGWTFTATKGDNISASTGITLEDSNMSMNIKLIAPNGEILDSDSMSGNGAYVSDTATETGTYTLVVYEWHQDNEGDYTINLVVSGDGLTISSDDEGGAIASGSKKHGNLTFGDIDGWTFTATKGDNISASTGITLEDSNMSMNIKLIAPNGDILDTDSMSGNGAYVSDTATETGTYTLVVYEWHQDNEGDYTLNLVVSGGGLTISTDDEGGAIASGSKVDGNLTFGDIDGWTFSAVAGSDITASAVTKIDGSMSMNIKLISPSGEILDSDSMSGNEANVSDTATETGVYTLVVYEWHQDNEGDYSLSLN